MSRLLTILFIASLASCSSGGGDSDSGTGVQDDVKVSLLGQWQVETWHTQKKGGRADFECSKGKTKAVGTITNYADPDDRSRIGLQAEVGEFLWQLRADKDGNVLEYGENTTFAPTVYSPYCTTRYYEGATKSIYGYNIESTATEMKAAYSGFYLNKLIEQGVAPDKFPPPQLGIVTFNQYTIETVEDYGDYDVHRKYTR